MRRSALFQRLIYLWFEVQLLLAPTSGLPSQAFRHFEHLIALTVADSGVFFTELPVVKRSWARITGLRQSLSFCCKFNAGLVGFILLPVVTDQTIQPVK